MPSANTTRNILPIWSCLGWNTLRVYGWSDVAVTLNIFQKERLGTFRQTDADPIPSGGQALRANYVIAAELLRIQFVTVTAPTVFAFFAALYP